MARLYLPAALSLSTLAIGIVVLPWVHAASAPGLVAAYDFDEGTGTVLTDRSGSGNNGVVSGATWVAGKNGGGLSFNGTSNLVTVADADVLDLAGTLTLEAWVKTASTSGNRRLVLDKEGSGFLSYALYANDAVNRPGETLHLGTTDVTVDGTSQLALNVWTHVAATYSGASMTLFINGVPVSSVSQTGTIAPSTGALRLGGSSQFGRFFSGTLDDVRIYNRALSQSEIQTDMATSLP